MENGRDPLKRQGGVAWETDLLQSPPTLVLALCLPGVDNISDFKLDQCTLLYCS